MKRLSSLITAVFALAVLASPGTRARAAAPQPAASAKPPGQPADYDVFVKGAAVSSGLLTVVRKAGKLYLGIPVSQLGRDLIETSVPSSGLGGFGPAPGEPYVAPARVIHFQRVDDRIVILWPNEIAKVDPNTPQATSTHESLPSSVIAVTPIVAQSSSLVLISADPFLGDVADLASQFQAVAPHPGHTYRLDPARTYFSQAKAFPQNTLLRVSQTWATDDPDVIDNVPDPRSVEVDMTYNFIEAPSDGYVPRLSDPRVGYFEQPLLNFESDAETTRNVYYVTRWNFMPALPGQPSQAKHPLLFTISNDVPVEYRPVVRAALLQWNAAFERIGIQNAVQVQQQPDDPNFDVDDIRNNMVRWIDTTNPQYGAEALIVDDPRTGEEINAGINFDAVLGPDGPVEYRYLVAPARGIADGAGAERRYTLDLIESIVLHESGHDLGLQHNFIGSMAYTAKDLQDPGFTSRYGVASSVMEYAPINLWPKGTAQGDYFQLVLGPYDYYAVHYGYAYVPNAATPDQEKATLNRWASRWSDPMYRFASDEDAYFPGGHAIDPRVQQDDLTDKPLQWEELQLAMLHRIMNAVDRRFPAPGQPYTEARRAFLTPLRYYVRDVQMPAHVIGGEYVSRARAGDPHSAPPLEPVSRAYEREAWLALERYLFSDEAWHFSPAVLQRLPYREVSAFTNGTWVYDPTPRHDVAVVEVAASTQAQVMNELFGPLTLQRIDELQTKYAPGSTMTLTDLFDWTRAGIFGDLENGRIARAGVVRRNAQAAFAKRLAALWLDPAPGTPPDAQALARLQLEDLQHSCALALRVGKFDEQTRAHVEALQAMATQALQARATYPATPSALP
ncbi:MAG TPA: zinc-dependent metalloprotease [Candidatus Acidoferrales bacterium]|nr:zinc-dependent metalloprotease [Candidatus Acidoferrales bacterium]